MNRLKYILAALAAVSLASCELERLDYTEISPENFYQNENDLKLAVNALYYDFNCGTWNGEGIYSAGYGGYQVLSDMTTDVLWSCWGWESDNLYYQQWTSTMSGDLQNHIYSAFSHYNFLSRARNTVRDIENSPVADDIKTRYIAEAKALRGWMGLYLYDLFGPVPVASDEVLDDPETFVYLGRLTDEEYDTMMENDLRDAIAGLPEKAEATGRVSKGAAMMILLKYYMIRGFFEEAETLARELYAMEGSVYSLQDDYNFNFSEEGKGNSEIILQIACNNSAEWLSNHMIAEIMPADFNPRPANAAGWGGYVMPWDFYNTFEENDERKARIFTSYTNDDGDLVDRTNSSQLSYGAIPLLYEPEEGMTGEHSSIDLVIYRYSDVLLTLAECIVRNSGSVSQEAINLVNRVRGRAGLENMPAEDTGSAAAFLDALLEERGHEFFLEGLRRQDLIRFGKYVEYANDRIEKVNNESNRGYFTVNDGHNRFWIPQTFIDESLSAIKQNDKY